MSFFQRKNRDGVRTHFWHLAGLALDVLGLGETHSGGPQDMDKEEGDKLCPNRQATGCRSPCPRTRHLVIHKPATQEADILSGVGNYK